MIKGFRFTNQLSNAEVDARIHQEIFNKSDGIFYGMELSYTNNSITVSEGLCEIAGRPVGIVGSETVEVEPDLYAYRTPLYRQSRGYSVGVGRVAQSNERRLDGGRIGPPRRVR